MGRFAKGIGGLCLCGLLAGCPNASDIPGVTTGLTTGVATDTLPLPETGQPEQTRNGEFGDLCDADEQCRERACLTLVDLGLVDDTFETGGQFPPDTGLPEVPIDTDGSVLDDVYNIGICSRECATLFQCPEQGWSCNLDVGQCVPDEIPNEQDFG